MGTARDTHLKEEGTLRWLFNFLNPAPLKGWRNFFYDLSKDRAA